MSTLAIPTPVLDVIEEWDGAADSIRTWWPEFEALMGPVTATMIGWARLPATACAVDIASGFGEPALSVARHLNPGGRVVATDVSPGMLAIAAERASQMGLTNVEMTVMDATAPTLPEATFDALFCRLGLMFLPDLDATLARLATLLVPGGRAVVAAWGPSWANPWLTLPLGVLHRWVTPSPTPTGTPGLFGLSDPERLTGSLAGAGLHDVRWASVPLRASWGSTAAFVDFHRRGPMQRHLAGLSLQDRTLAWAAVSSSAERRWGRGPLHLPGQVLVAAATR